jgi:hypothetical protein
VAVAAAGLIEAGVRFIESLTATTDAASLGGGDLGQMLGSLITHDEGTKQTRLSIPLPESVSQERLTTAVSALWNRFARAASASSASQRH